MSSLKKFSLDTHECLPDGNMEVYTEAEGTVLTTFPYFIQFRHFYDAVASNNRQRMLYWACDFSLGVGIGMIPVKR